MKVNLLPAYKALLLQTPIDTPLLVGLRNRKETGVAMRVHDLFSVRRQGLPITVGLVGAQGKEGIWITAVAFRLGGESTSSREGVVYVNPRQHDEYRLLQHLTIQERLLFLFLSPHLKVTVAQETQWSIHSRQEARILLAQIDHSLGGKKLNGSVDPDFETAKKEFQRLYSPARLLVGHTASEARMGSPFRGVVLD